MVLRMKQGLGSVAIALSLPIAIAAPPDMAEAATLIYSTPVFSPAAPEDTSFFWLPYFDPSLGRLESVKLELVGEAQSWVQLENLAPARGGFGRAYATAGATAIAFTTREGVSLRWPVADEARARISQALTPFDGSADFAGTSGAAAEAQKTFDAALLVDPTSFGSDMNFFEGVGSYAVQLYAATEGAGQVSSDDFAFDMGGEVADLGLRVTYDYTPAVATPEPGVSAALLPGLMGLGLVLLRRRSGTH